MTTCPTCGRKDRSKPSHDHYFAAVEEAWRNLPEDQADRFPTPKHLRKWALIRSGYANHRQLVCASEAEARRVAAFLKPADPYALVAVIECTVSEWTAKSQKAKSMDAKEFQASKEAVLCTVSELLGVSVAGLKDAAKRAA